jgi:tape measure domain-containing protein
MAGFDVGSIVAHVKADITDFKKGMDEAKAHTTAFQGYIENATDASKKFTAGVAVAGTALFGLGVAGIRSAGEFEQSRVAFETMLGSADKARQMMQDIAKFAKETPFELPEVVKSSKQLLAFGFAQEQIIPTMRKLGDLSAGLGVPIGQLTNVFGQVRVAGRLMGQDLLQFTNAGVPLIEALAKTMKKPQTEIKQLVEQGKVGFPEVETAINSLTEANSKFGGMMEKQSHTLNGVISNIKDGFGQALRSMVGITVAGDIIQGGLFDKIKRGAEAVIPIVQRLPELITSGFNQIQPYLPQIAGAITGMMIPAIISMTIAFSGFLLALAPFAVVGAGLVMLFNQLGITMGDWSRLWGTLTGAMQAAWSAIDSLLMPSLRALWGTIVTQLWPALQRLWDTLEPVLIPALKFLAIVLGSILYASIWMAINAINAIIQVISVLISVLSNLTQWARNTAGAVGDAFAVMRGRASSAFDAIWGMIQSVENKFSEIIGSIRGALSGVYDAITGPFRRAFSAVSDEVDGLKSKLTNLNPFQRHSPSLFDLVSKGTEAIRKEYSNMFGSIGGMAQAFGQIGPAIAPSTNNSVHNNTSNAFNAPINIGSEVDADNFLRRLSRNDELTSMGLSER